MKLFQTGVEKLFSRKQTPPHTVDYLPGTKTENNPQYLTTSECTEWLRQHRITEAPYGKFTLFKNKYCCQYRVLNKEDFASEAVGRLASFKEALLVIVDWHFHWVEDDEDPWIYYKAHQIPFIKMAQSLISQYKPIPYKGFGLLYLNKREEIISHIKVAIEMGWSVYLYPDSADTTLYFWEGDIMDIWSNSKTIFSEFKKLVS